MADIFDETQGSIDPFEATQSGTAAPTGGFRAAAKQAVGATIKGAGQLASDVAPALISQDNALKQYGQEVIDANPTEVQGFRDIVNKPVTTVKEAAGNAAGSMGLMLGMRGLGAGITALSPLTGVAAPVVAGVGQAIAIGGPLAAAALPSFGGIREKQIEKNPQAETDFKAKAVAALGAGTVGWIETKFGPQDWALKLTTATGRKQLANILESPTLLGAVKKGVIKGGAVEGAEELVQSPVEQLASGDDPTTKESLTETAFGGAMGAVGGGVLGGAMAPMLRQSKEKDMAQKALLEKTTPADTTIDDVTNGVATVTKRTANSTTTMKVPVAAAAKVMAAGGKVEDVAKKQYGVEDLSDPALPSQISLLIKDKKNPDGKRYDYQLPEGITQTDFAALTSKLNTGQKLSWLKKNTTQILAGETTPAEEPTNAPPPNAQAAPVNEPVPAEPPVPEPVVDGVPAALEQEQQILNEEINAAVNQPIEVAPVSAAVTRDVGEAVASGATAVPVDGGDVKAVGTAIEQPMSTPSEQPPLLNTEPEVQNETTQAPLLETQATPSASASPTASAPQGVTSKKQPKVPKAYVKIAKEIDTIIKEDGVSDDYKRVPSYEAIAAYREKYPDDSPETAMSELAWMPEDEYAALTAVENEEVLLSQTQATGTTTQQVEQELKDFLGQGFANLVRKGKLEVVQGVEQLPEAGVPLYTKTRKIAGVYLASKQKVVLVADSIEKGQARFVAIHEAVHALLREDKVFIKQKDKILSDFARLIKTDASAQAALERVPSSTKAEVITEEALAHWLQSPSNHQHSLFKRIISAIKAALYRLGIAPGRLTAADMSALFTQGTQAWARQGEMSVGEFAQVLFSIVDDTLAKKLEAGKKVKLFRAMQLIDGKLYPPMSAKVDGKLREPTELGQWEQAEENPSLADDKGMFKLDKANKSAIAARYNPYFHSSPSPLNDQFSSAYARPNLVTVEVEVPASELAGVYKADKAKDSVGMKNWNAGPVSGKLPVGKKRTVALTRYAKAVRVVPDSEVAREIANLLEGENLAIPDNVITPSLKVELQKLGVKITRSKQVTAAIENGTYPQEAPSDPELLFSRIDDTLKAGQKKLDTAVQALKNPKSKLYDLYVQYAPQWLSVTPLHTLAQTFGKTIPQIRQFAKHLDAVVAGKTEIVDTSAVLYEQAEKLAEAGVGMDVFNTAAATASFNRITPWADLYDQAWVPETGTKSDRLKAAQKAWVNARMQKATGKSYIQAYTEAKQAYAALKTEDLKQAYIKVVEHIASVRIRERNNLLAYIESVSEKGTELRANLMAQFEASFSNLHGAYWPLSRVGDFRMEYTDTEGFRTVKHYTTLAERREDKAAILAEGVDPATIKEDYKDKQPRGSVAIPQMLMGQLAEAVEKKALTGVDPNNLDAVEAAQERAQAITDDMNQIWLRWQPETSALKNSVRRKNVKGFSKEMLRSYLDYMQRHASNIAWTEQGKKIEQDIKSLADDINEAKNEDGMVDVTMQRHILNDLRNRIQALRSVSVGPVASILGKLGTAYYMTSPSIALVQMSQLGVLTLPKLSTMFGAGKASTALAKGTRDAFKKDYTRDPMFADPVVNTVYKNMREVVTDENRTVPQARGKELGERLFTDDQILSQMKSFTPYQMQLLTLREAMARNLLDISAAHEAYELTRGKDPKSVWNRAFKFAMLPMSLSELASRKATVLATLELAQQNGQNFFGAMNTIAEVVNDTLYSYSKENKGSAMQGGLSRVVLQFQHYRIMTGIRLAMLFRNAVKGESAEVKQAATKELAGIMGMSAAFAGTLGLPMSGLVFSILNLLLGDDDEPIDSELLYTNWLRENLGETLGDVAASGLPTIAGADLSGRIGLSGIYGIQNEPPSGLHGRNLAAWWAASQLGPIFSVGQGWFQGYDEIVNKGNYLKGLEAATPKPIKDVLKSIRIGTEGLKTGQGKRLLADEAIGPDEIILVALGFNADEIAKAQSAERSLTKLSTKISERRGLLIRQAAQAFVEGDDASPALEKIRNFNRSMPRFGINGGDIRPAIRKILVGDTGTTGPREAQVAGQFEIPDYVRE